MKARDWKAGALDLAQRMNPSRDSTKMARRLVYSKSRVGRARAKLVKLLDGEAPRKSPSPENVRGAFSGANSALITRH